MVYLPEQSMDNYVLSSPSAQSIRAPSDVCLIQQQQVYPLQQQSSGHLQQQPVGHLQQQPVGHLQQQPVCHLQQQFLGNLQQQPVGHLQQQPVGPLEQQLSGPIQQIYGHLEQQLVYPQQQQQVYPLQQQQSSGPLQKQLSGPLHQQYVEEELGRKRERGNDILRHMDQLDFDVETEPRKRSAYSSCQSSDTGIGVRYDKMNDDQLRQLVIERELRNPTTGFEIKRTSSGISNVPHTAQELVIDAAMDELASGMSMDDDTLLLEFGAPTPRNTAPTPTDSLGELVSYVFGDEDTSILMQLLEWKYDGPE